MRRGSFKRRLPRGRLQRRRINPVLPGAAILLVLLVPAFLYFQPNITSSHFSFHDPSEKSPSASSLNLSGQVLKIASSNQVPSDEETIDSGLVATVKSSGEGVVQVHLENAGQVQLERVNVREEKGKSLGVLSMLSPGEKKVLAMGGPARRIKISALDPSGREVTGEVHYEETSSIPFAFSGGLPGGSNEIKLDAKAISPEMKGTGAGDQRALAGDQGSPAATISMTSPGESIPSAAESVSAANQSITAGQSAPAPAADRSLPAASQSIPVDQSVPAASQNAHQADLSVQAAGQSAPASHPSDPTMNQSLTEVASVPQKASEGPRLCVTIAANSSEGREGYVVGYRCTARNCGDEEISDVKLFCGERMIGTGFLTPGKELHLEGIHVVRESTKLSAGVQGSDADGRLWTNNTSIDIWKISPELRLKISGPKTVHRGERFTLDVGVQNAGNAPLTDIEVSDKSGAIERIDLLKPGEERSLQKETDLQESLGIEVSAVAFDPAGKEVYASDGTMIDVLKAGLAIVGQPSTVTVYPGQPADVTWVLSNTGQEILRNITLSGDDGKRCMLKELAPGRSVKMAAIYSVDETSLMNVTAQGTAPGGYPAVASGAVLIDIIQPGISLKVTPAKVEVCPGEGAEMSCLIANVGNDDLHDIVLLQQGSTLATLDELSAGDFRVVDSLTSIKDNTTIKFEVSGKDSRGQVWSDSAEVDADVVITALKVFASAAPQSVIPGNTTRITCTVANTGSTPLYSIFVISKAFGPLGTIDSLLPKRQKTVSAEKTVLDGVEDSISVEGFTQERTSVRSFCQVKIDVLRLPGLRMQAQNALPVQEVAAAEDASPDIKIRSVDVRCGDMDIPLSLPSEEETAVRISEEIAEDVDSSAKESTNQVMDGISRFLGYVQKVLERIGGNDEADAEIVSGSGSEYGVSSSQEQPISLEDAADLSSSRNYELSIESVKGSEHGAIRIMDVSAVPSQPAAWERVKLSVHVKSSSDIKAISARWGLSDVPLTKTDMMGVDRVYDMPMVLESGNGKDGYWSCALPGNAAGTYMALSVWLTDGSTTAEGGPYMIHWSTVNSAETAGEKQAVAPHLEDGMLFIESTTVRGKGEVSIKDTFKGSAMEFNEKMKGNGSISLESLRCIDKKAADNFTEKKDLVFTDGQLKGHQRVSSPTFHGGLGASVTERFNLSHVDKSETSSVSSANFANNTLAFNTEQAFDGTWNIQTQYAKFYKKIKADQQYTGSFQTEKKIKFQDYGQN